MATASSSNAVQIVINATNNASTEIKKTVASLSDLGKAARSSIPSLREIGEAIKSGATEGQLSIASLIQRIGAMGNEVGKTAGPFITLFNTLYTGFSNVSSLIEAFRTNDAIQSFFSGIAKQADDALDSFDYNLAGVADGIGTYGASILSGFGSAFKEADQKVAATAKTAEAVLPAFERLQLAVHDSFKAIADGAAWARAGLESAFDKTTIGQGLLTAKIAASTTFELISNRAGAARLQMAQAFNGSAIGRAFAEVRVLASIAFDDISKRAERLQRNLKEALGFTTPTEKETARPVRALAAASTASATAQSSEPAIVAAPSIGEFAKIEQAAVKASATIARQFKIASDQAKAGINQIGSSFGNTIRYLDDLTSRLSERLDIGAKVAGYFGANDAIDIFNGIKGQVNAVSGSLFNATQEMAMFGMGLASIQQIAAGPFQFLIGQNVELQEQLLATKSSLVATNEVMLNGREVKDPTAAITSLTAPVDTAIESLRTKSLDLVGVTSKELVPAFQIIAGFSSQIGLSLEQVSDLTASTAAAMGTLQIPLGQARQEISSILSGSIDMNSVLAKSLGITNQQVSIWQSQGQVFEQLTTRLEAFRAGNKLASETITGYSSNIQELFDIIGQKAGAQLLEPITKQMGAVYAYLKENQQALIDFGTQVTGELMTGALAVVDSIGEVFKLSVPIGKNTILILVDGLKEGMLALANAIKLLTPIFQPLISILGFFSSQAGSVLVPMLQMAITMKTAQFAIGGLTAGFGGFMALVPGVGEILALTTGYGNSMIRTFSGLSGPLSAGGASALLLGKNLGSIPGAAGALTSKLMGATKGLGGMGSMLGMLVPGFVALTPQLATAGIRVVGLAKDIPALGQAFSQVLPFIKANAGELTRMAEQYGPLVDRLIPGMSSKMIEATRGLTTYADAGVLRKAVDQQAIVVTKSLGAALAQSALKWGLIASAAYVAYQVIDKFILQNQEVMATLGAAFSGIGDGIGQLFSMIVDAISTAVNAVVDLINVVKSFLGLKVQSFQAGVNDFITAPIVLATAAIIGLLIAGEKIALLQGGLTALGFTQMAAGAVQASIGFQALKIFMLEGAQASAIFMGANNLNHLTMQKVKDGIWANVVAMKAWIVETLKAAWATSKEFLKSVAQTIIALGKAAAAATWSALSFIFLGKSATAAGDALTWTAVKAKLAAFWTGTIGPAAAGGATGLIILAKAAWKAVAGMVALAGPLIALAGAIALTGLVIYTNNLKVANETSEIHGKEVERLALRNLKLAQSFKIVASAQERKTKAGIRLTADEYKANQSLAAQAELQIKDNLDRIAQINAEGKNDKTKDRAAAQIKELEDSNARLTKLSQNVQISAKDLPRLGTAYEQFAQEVSTALEAIRNPSGEPDLYKKQADLLLASTQGELKANLITADEAIARLSLLATAVGADKETQIKAREAITAARKQQNDQDTENLAAAESKVKSLQETGKLGQAEAEQQLTEIKQKELDTQLAALKQNKADSDKVRADDINKALAEADLKIAEAQKALAAAQGDPAAIKEVNERQQQDLKDGKAQTVAELAKIEAEIADIQKGASGKRGAEANAATNKVIDLQEKVVDLNRSLGEADKKLEGLDKQAQNPTTKGAAVDAKAVQAAKDALTTTQDNRFEIQKKGDTANANAALDQANGEAANNEKSAKLKAEALKNAYDQKLRYQDEDQKDLDSLFAAKKISEEKYSQDSLTITENRLDVELAEVARQRALLSATDKNGLNKLEAQESEINKKRTEAQEKFYQKRQEIGLRRQDDLQKILDGEMATGLVSEEDYAEKSLDIINRRLDLELAEVERQRKRLSATDKSGLLSLEAQEAEINKKRTEALEKIVQQRISILERAEKKAMDVAQAAAIERDTQLQELKNANLIYDEEANVEQVKSDRARLEAQLEAETAFREQLEKLPMPSDPQKEAERQTRIRAARLKTAETTKQIVDNEGKQQEAQVALLRAVIDRALQDKKNGLEAERQQIQKALELQTAMVEAMERQNKVLESRKTLEKALNDYVAGEYALALSLATTAEDKERLEQKIAEARLVFLQRQQDLEQRSLENDLAKNKLMLEREKIQLRLAKADAKVERAEKEAELEKVLADPKATTRQKKAAQLSVDALTLKEDLLDYKGLTLDYETQIQQDDGENQRQGLKMKQGLELDQERVNYATKFKNYQDPIVLEQMGWNAEAAADYGARGAYVDTVNATDKPTSAPPPDMDAFLASRGRSVSPTNGAPGTSEKAQIMQRFDAIGQAEGAVPTLTRAEVPIDFAGGVSQMVLAIGKLNQDLLAGFAGMGSTGQIIQQAAINQYFQGDDVKTGAVAKKVEQDSLNGLYNVLLLAKQKKINARS